MRAREDNRAMLQADLSGICGMGPRRSGFQSIFHESRAASLDAPALQGPSLRRRKPRRARLRQHHCVSDRADDDQSHDERCRQSIEHAHTKLPTVQPFAVLQCLSSNEVPWMSLSPDLFRHLQSSNDVGTIAMIFPTGVEVLGVDRPGPARRFKLLPRRARHDLRISTLAASPGWIWYSPVAMTSIVPAIVFRLSIARAEPVIRPWFPPPPACECAEPFSRQSPRQRVLACGLPHEARIRRNLKDYRVVPVKRLPMFSKGPTQTGAALAQLSVLPPRRGVSRQRSLAARSSGQRSWRRSGSARGRRRRPHSRH